MPEIRDFIASAPARAIISSHSLLWQGIVIEKTWHPAGSSFHLCPDRHVVSMATGAPVRFEYVDNGTAVRCVSRAGAIMSSPRGLRPRIELETDAEFVHCAFDQDFLQAVNNGLERAGAPRFRASFQDKAIKRIMEMLIDELAAGVPSGRVYVDSLAHALATRYLRQEQDARDRTQASALPARILNRVREKMEANLDTNLGLDMLASESGYSRSHFIRMFRVATGLTPHQYVLSLRLKRAQAILSQKRASIIDVAMSCGFSSQAHMTNVFRQHLEMTPAEFRRNA